MLTDRSIRAFRPKTRTDLADGHIAGLVLRCTPAGKRTWALRYRPAPGTRNVPVETYVLGEYGDQDQQLTIAAARKAAQKVRRRVDAGENPAKEKRTAKTEAERTGDTVADLAKDYIRLHAKVHKKSWRDDQRMLDVEILPTWKARKVTELTRRDVRVLIEAIADRGSPITANRCLALVRKMLNFGISKDWIEANPAALMPKPGAERSRDRVLSDAEIRLVWDACERERPAMCALTRLRLLTAQRGAEVAAMRWQDVDLDTGWWTIPANVTKNKIAHRVPLAPKAVEILKTLPIIEDVDYVFPAASGNRHCGDAKKAGQRIAKRVLATLQKTDPSIKAFDFRGHDLRRTAATKMAEAGITTTTISRVLNHAEGGPRATQVYNRYEYDVEKRIGLETWGRALTAILEQKPAPAAVVAFTKGAR
jgi:integrase